MTHELGVVEDTLFVPMLGRIYASQHFKKILYDEKALELKDRLPKSVFENDTQTQYTYLASASRSANMDRYVKDFLNREENGVIAELGCGLETTYYRNDNGKTKWYAIDLPHVIGYRRQLLEETKREKYLEGDAFQKDWIETIRKECGDVPVLVLASGLFYYFREEEVVGLLKMLEGYGKIEVVFDAVNRSGMQMMHKKYMKTVGHGDARMFFYVDSAEDLVRKNGLNCSCVSEEKYYRRIPREGLDPVTRFNMWASDLFSMVKMIHLKNE